MGQLQFQEGDPLHAQSISDEETRKIIALWADEHDKRLHQAAQPTAQAISEALGISPEEVRRLLTRVRASEAGLSASRSTVPVRRSGARSAGWIVAIAVVALALLALIRSIGANSPIDAPATVSVESDVHGADGSTSISGLNGRYVRHADGSVILDTPQGRYERHADGSLNIQGPEGHYSRAADGSVEIDGPGGRYVRRADGSEERTGTPPARVTPPTPPSGVSLPEVP